MDIKRDPRVDPRAGDVVRRRGGDILTVLIPWPYYVRYESSAVASSSFARSYSYWRRMCSTAEIVKVADV